MNTKNHLIILILLLQASSMLFSQGLGELASSAGLNFGTPVQNNQFVAREPDYINTLVGEFNMFFPGNDLKFMNVQPTRGVFNFAMADSIVAYAEAHGKKVRGHCLIWHSYSQNPKWLTDKWYGTSPWTRAELLAIMKSHITTVVSRYKGRISEWDVVNEGISLGDGHPNGLRKSQWQSIIGDDYIDSAFVWAHRADPSAYLYFNEYGAEGAISSEYAKRDSVYSLVKRLLSRGIPIHGVGLQAHFGNYVNTGAIAANIKKLGELGLRVSITELDMMNTSNLPANWKGMINACLDNYNCTTFATWGIDDLHSWKGKDCGCLIWDSLFVKKAAVYKAVSDALSAANPTISAQRKAFMSVLPYPQSALPVTNTTLNYCTGDVPVALSATGTKLRWYADSKTSIYNLTPPTPSTSVEGTKSYFVSQILNFIESPRVEIKVTVSQSKMWYKDEDGDGVGDPTQSQMSCTQPIGYVAGAPNAVDDLKQDSPKLIISKNSHNNELTIKMSTDELIDEVRILTVTGVVIVQKSVNQAQLKLNQNLSKGFYVVELKSNMKTYTTQLVR